MYQETTLETTFDDDEEPLISLSSCSSDDSLSGLGMTKTPFFEIFFLYIFVVTFLLIYIRVSEVKNDMS